MITGRVYYDKLTGTPITHYTSNHDIPWTVEMDFERIMALREYVRETVGVIELEEGQFEQDFRDCNGFRVNVTQEPHELEFSYPDPNEPEAPPIYQPPLSEKVANLEAENLLLKTRDAQIQDDQLFILEVLAENGLL
jgi:hypothetical protein